MWRGGRAGGGTLTGLSGLFISASSDWSLQPPFPDRHPAGKAWGTDLLCALQGAVLQNLREVGALAPNHLHPEADACSPDSSPSLCSILSLMSSLPGAKLLMTIIPHVPHLTLYKSSGTCIISCCPSKNIGMEHNANFHLIHPPLFSKETEDQVGNGP